jgi:hypothetical protein
MSNSEQLTKRAAREALLKEVADTSAELRERLASIEEAVSSIAKQARPGGPSLDGQPRSRQLTHE